MNKINNNNVEISSTFLTSAIIPSQKSSSKKPIIKDQNDNPEPRRYKPNYNSIYKYIFINKRKSPNALFGKPEKKILKKINSQILLPSVILDNFQNKSTFKILL